MDRPDTVPAAATWEASTNEWVLAPTDDEGRKHGLVTWWRPDGTRSCTTEFAAGNPEGSFQRFHESGEVSRDGAFVQGQLHGTNTFWRSDSPTTENFPAGLGERVWRAEMEYRGGNVVQARAYDRDGKRVLEDGSPFPESTPAGVPDSAHFRKEDDGWAWVHGAVEDDDGERTRVGEWRWWSADGVLQRARTYEDGTLHGPQVDYADGEPVSTTTYTHGDATGPFDRPADADAYTVDAARERGTLAKGDITGTLTLVDAEGTVLVEVERGLEADQSLIAEVLDGAADLDALDQAGQHSAAFLGAVLAREPVEGLERRLVAMQGPVSAGTRSHGTQWGQSTAHNVVRFGGSPVAVVQVYTEAIRIGGDAGDLLRAGAATLDDMGLSELASAFVDAACAIDADYVAHEYTRALVRMSLGDAEGAAASIQRMDDAGEAGMVQGLRPYCRAIFEGGQLDAEDPRVALAEKLAPHLGRVANRHTPSVDKVRRLLQQLATRIGDSREHLVERFGEVDWLPPRLDQLLPDGPVEVELPEEEGIGRMHAVRRDLLLLRTVAWILELDLKGLPDTVSVSAERPSRALSLAVIARYLQVTGQEVDVGRFLGEEDDAEALVPLVREIAGEQPWYGLELQHCNRANGQFARDDDGVLIGALVNGWTEEHTPFDG